MVCVEAMEILKRRIPSPVVKQHAEALALAVHVFMLERDYQIYIPPNQPQTLNSMGLPKEFDSFDNEWHFLYTNPNFSNYLSVACGIWGPKMLVRMEEFAKTENEEYTKRSEHQFGIGQENYAHEADVEQLDRKGEFSWDILANAARLHELVNDMVAHFEDKLEASAPSERESSASGTSIGSNGESAKVLQRLPAPATLLVVSLLVGFGAIVLFKVLQK